MKTLKHLSFLLILFCLATILSCQKNGGGGGTTDDKLVVVTSPAADGHVEAPGPGPNFNLNVTISSPMPSGGVKIDVSARPDGGTVNFFSATKTTTTASNDFSITGATVSVLSVATVTVTAVSNSSNTFTGSYRFSRK